MVIDSLSTLERLEQGPLQFYDIVREIWVADPISYLHTLTTDKASLASPTRSSPKSTSNNPWDTKWFSKKFGERFAEND